MPEPKPGETKQNFVQRCIPEVLEDGAAESNDQAVAICNSIWDEAQNVTQNALIFTTNQVTGTKRQNIGGVEYLVAPIVLIREGVLNGELVQPSEFNRHYASWNGRPFVVDHPRDTEHNGVTANHPLTLVGQNPNVVGGMKIGEIYNAEPLEDRLRAEVWIPVEQATNRGGEALEILKRLDSKQPLEVSTAYWRDLEMQPGTWNNEPYYGTAHNLKPDHVAGLLHTVGACSWEDGCGAPRLNEEGGMAVMEKAHKPSYSGTNKGQWNRPRLEDFGFDASSVSDLSAEQRREVAAISLLGNPEADDFSEMSFFPVVNPTNNDLYESALEAVISGRGAQANIPANAKESAQRMARRLLNDEFDRDLELEEVQHNLKKYLRVIANWVRGEAQEGISIEEDTNMDEREKEIARLVEATEFSEEDLTALSDCGLKALAELIKEPEAEPVVEPEPEPEPETNTDEYVSKSDYDAMFAQMTARLEGLEAEVRQADIAQHSKLVKALVANDKCAVSEEKLKAMDVDTLEALQQSLVPQDFRGAGGGPQADEQKDWVIYDRSFREVANG